MLIPPLRTYYEFLTFILVQSHKIFSFMVVVEKFDLWYAFVCEEMKKL